jgi:hypothetical protein
MFLITVTQNTTTGRFHPFVWRQAPTPSDDGTGLVRYRSKMHHTEGFTTHGEARESIVGDCPLLGRVEANYGPARFVDVLDTDTWADGEVPARVMWADR